MAPTPNSESEDYPENLDDMEEVEVDDDIVVEYDEDDDDDDGDGLGEDFDIIDEAKLTFQQHTSSVFTIDVSQSEGPPLVVTGGEDDKGVVWNYDSGQVLFDTGTSHKDSVTSVGFSSDSKYVMTADMGGIILVHSTTTTTTAAGPSSTEKKLVWDYECSDIEWCKWHRSAHVLFAGTSLGDVYMWKIPSGDCKIYASHGSRTTCGAITPNGKEIIVGYEDGTLKKWDLKDVSCVFHHKPEHGDPILCLDVLSVGQKNGNLVAMGTEGGTISLVNSHTGKQVCKFAMDITQANEMATAEDEDEGMEEPMHTIESVSFSPCGSYVAGASVNGNLIIWDISVQRVRHTCPNPAGLTKLVWSHAEPNYIITAGLDGVVRLWDHRNGELFKELTGHLGNILDIVISKDGSQILTAGDDSTARVFEK